MKLSEIKNDWTFTKNIGSTSYWFEETVDGSGKTIGPEEVLEIGCQLESENEALRERKNTAYEECDYLTLQSKRLRGGLSHIKRWSSGEIVTMNPKQILDAVVRMCDDALLTGEQSAD